MPESFGRGALTEAAYYILLSMYEPIHGYAVMQKIEEMSGGRVKLGAGTLYGAINTLLEKDWIKAVKMEDSVRKKEYVITAKGQEAVERELTRLRELVANGEARVGR